MMKFTFVCNVFHRICPFFDRRALFIWGYQYTSLLLELVVGVFVTEGGRCTGWAPSFNHFWDAFFTVFTKTLFKRFIFTGLSAGADFFTKTVSRTVNFIFFVIFKVFILKCTKILVWFTIFHCSILANARTFSLSCAQPRFTFSIFIIRRII